MKWVYNKNVIITGVSSGIGKSLATLLIKKYNCKVLGVARSVGKLETLKTELGDSFNFYPMDVTSKDEWLKFASGAASEFEPDILINNAGIIHPFKNVIDLTEEEIDRTIKTNYISIVLATRAMIPVLQRSRTPGLLNISSASALLPVAGESIYSSTKAAAYAFSEAVRQEYRRQGWYVGYVLPGPVKTDLYASKDKGGENSEKVKDKIITQVGMTSERAAKIIARRMNFKSKRILVGGIAWLMGFCHSLFPSSTISITGRLIRALPLDTFKGVFEGDEAIRQVRKAQRKAYKLALAKQKEEDSKKK